jgi:hypothetical protein
LTIHGGISHCFGSQAQPTGSKHALDSSSLRTRPPPVHMGWVPAALGSVLVCYLVEIHYNVLIGVAICYHDDHHYTSVLEVLWQERALSELWCVPYALGVVADYPWVCRLLTKVPYYR